MANMTDTKGLYQITDYPMERLAYFMERCCSLHTECPLTQESYRIYNWIDKLLHKDRDHVLTI